MAVRILAGCLAVRLCGRTLMQIIRIPTAATMSESRGGTLAAGEFVLLGSVVETRWVAAGDRVEIEIEGLGQASCHQLATVVPALPDAEDLRSAKRDDREPERLCGAGESAIGGRHEPNADGLCDGQMQGIERPQRADRRAGR